MIAVKIRRLFYSYIFRSVFFIMFLKFLNAYKKYYKIIAETTNLIF
ncbi:hypothetical protein CHAB381_0674 [Campylobacter hominis ATCC BAA-381]|uniref:Uncharacterized protein n=1 Tax=Campylobacter hominis (strain ATCC BAA-381 / DSM 21671 / CCUG 45161 / LMG 19568 / NCTC 13146 / CH001A) TaxID=360107 RepID=A7I164_CAMHC|nr:hypothetical protein CHAB381_0674 [Campylobacter hominis ATCC BAA-381]